MKKLNLSKLNFSQAEVLTREELKKILGGLLSEGGQCNFQINYLINGGTQSGGTCTGPSDPQYGCAPTEQTCYNDANDWCAQTPGCGGCVPY